jgi:hypothetical protein
MFTKFHPFVSWIDCEIYIFSHDLRLRGKFFFRFQVRLSLSQFLLWGLGSIQAQKGRILFHGYEAE